ncbi:epimerase [Burkholderia gladioli]|uniref:epimerase n=1 Tax=Burkholderia gladioli TaxID=28095 RepID=UPI00163F9960|nr:DUF1731 domain-containing protein [Burkholderia gladioli]
MNTVPALDWAVALLIVQGLMGGFDTLYHHEFTEDLAHRPKARLELAIHAVRALLYGLAFASIAHLAFLGAWTLAIAALVLVEVLLTLWDFVVEDGSRKLPATERVLHTLLAINGGAVFGLYAMQLWHWASLPTALMRLELGWRGWLLSLFALGVAASGLRDGLAAWRMGRRAPPANPFAGQAHRSVLVTGGTGFIGEALVGQLLDAGHRVTLLTRSPLRAAYQFGGRVRCVTALDQLHAHEHVDVVINLAGAPVLGPRWSAKRQATLLASRVGVTEALLRWEAAAAPLDAWPIRKVVLRLGLVFGPGGALPPMLLPYRVGLGGRLGDGRQVMSWMHRDDVLRLIAEAMHRDTMRGVYNAVAPEAPSQAEFARTAGRVLRRPAWFRLPAAPLRRAAGEMAELLLDGQHVVPARLQREGFVFRFAGLEAALRDLVER